MLLESEEMLADIISWGFCSNTLVWGGACRMMRCERFTEILMSPNVAAAAARIIVVAIMLSLILLFLGIGVLVLIHVCIVGRAFRRGFGNGSMVERRRSPGRTSMSMDDLDRLPCFHFQATEKGSSPVDCAVCLDSFKMGDKCRLLPRCNHSFHAQCVDAWLLKTPICPICRTSTDFRKGVQVSGEESSHGNQTTEGIHARDDGIDSGDNPGAVTGIQLSPNQSRSSSPAAPRPAA